MPLIKIIATGGTIANTSHGLISIDEVLKDIPQARAMADFEVTEATRVRSGQMRLAQWFDIARAAISAAEDSRIDGIIVTHGTFTTEETAYFLHLAVRTEKPLVVVASQRKHDEVGNDGDRNMLDAIRLTLSPDARGKGVLVTLHEEIHSAREVVKTNQRPGGFHSLGRGILGHIEEDQVSFFCAPTRRHTFRSEFDIREIHELPRVDVIAAYVGGDDAAAQACVAAGARGLVISGYAYNGRPSADQLAGVEKIAASGIPVVLSNRGGQGRIPVDWNDPFIQGDSLVPHKARILLMLGLTKTKDPRELQRMFNEY
ncbi:MAG TPA: asparaginase [Candidatus Binatia bacterium]|jgi:L-asparaginase|nr:asparaginase [Candidatus Binatia bacterium]